MSKIILLNGVGSVGKSSIAKALQQIAAHPIWHVEMDVFLEMMPLRCMDHPDGLTFERLEQDGRPTVAVRSGPLVDKTLAAMRQSVAAMADLGCIVVVDDVIFGNTAKGDGHVVADYQRLLSDHDLFLVGVYAPLDVLEARERARGDREIGLARWQFDRVNVGFDYDLTVDTSKQTPQACAEQIKTAFDL